MAFASSSIIIILLVMSFILTRSGRGYGWGISIIPLIIVPAIYIIDDTIASWASPCSICRI
jgi:hypothetical protein